MKSSPARPGGSLTSKPTQLNTFQVFDCVGFFVGDSSHPKGRNDIASELAGHTDRLGSGQLLLDFTNVLRLGSIELRTLITLPKAMKASGGSLTLINLKTHVYEIFTVTRLDTLLNIYRHDQAPASTWPGA